MPWFVVDDSAHSHPKLIKAGNAAVGLWMRCGSYAAQHLTDGIVPSAVAAMYGTAPQAVKLVKVGLWHGAGHDCAGCPQPAEGDYVMHDYLAYNPTRRQVSDRRERAAEKKRKQRAQGGSGPKPPSNRPRIDDESSANRERIDDDSKSFYPPVSDETAGHDDVSRGDSPVTRARAFPSPPLPSKEQVVAVEGEGTGSAALAPARPDGRPPLAELPDAFELTDGMRRWAQQTYPRVDVDSETTKFVLHYRGEGTRRRNWYATWQKWIASANDYLNRHGAPSNVIALPTGQPRPSTTDARVAAALELGRQMQAAADARTAAQGEPA